MSAVAERVGSPPERRNETQYTTSRDPEIDLQVGELLREVTAAVVAELTPDALVLHGELGRGEGSAYRVDGCVVVLSHIELMAVYRGPLSLLRAWGARRHAAALGKRLGRFCGTTVTLTTQAALFLRWPIPSLRSFLMLRSARRLYGTVRFPPPWRLGIERVRPTEFAREVLRHDAGLVRAHRWITGGDGQLSEAAAVAAQREIDDTFLVCGDALLFQRGEYHDRALARAELLRALPVSGDVAPSARLRQEYEVAALRRLAPWPRASRDRRALFARWCAAAEEWLVCVEQCEPWRSTRSRGGSGARLLLVQRRHVEDDLRRVGRNHARRTHTACR